MKINQIFGKEIIFIITIFISVQSFGQRERGNLFTSTTRAEIGFTLEQSIKLDSMIANPIYSNHFFVKVNNLSEVIYGKTLGVNLPDKQNIELFYTKNINYKTNSEFQYFGDFDPCDEERMGNLTLIGKNGNVFGQLNIENEIYELQDFGGGKNVLFKINPTFLSNSKCATINGQIDSLHLKDNNESENEMVISLRDAICNVRVLVLYTSKSEKVGNPENSAELFINQSNQIFRNSGVNLTFSLAAVMKLVGFSEISGGSYEIDATLQNLRTNNYVKQLRIDKQADLVILLTDGNWGDYSYRYIGNSYLDNWGQKEYGYALADLDAAGGLYTFTHELAHDFGCKHDDDERGSPDFVYDARGYSFKAPHWWSRKRFTIMAFTSDNNDTRIMHFSNPQIKFKEKYTGIANVRDNAKQLNGEGCLVADYLPYIEPVFLKVEINGPAKGNNSGTYSWCINIQNCVGNPVILWEYSIDGVHYSTMATNQYCITAPLPLDASLWLRVTVTCDNQTITVWHYTLNENEIFCEHLIQEFSFEQNELPLNLENQDITNLRLFPNPAHNYIDIEMKLPEKSIVEIEMVDLIGKRVYKISDSEVYEKGVINRKFDISNIGNGFYCVKIKIGSTIFTQSIVKL